MKKFKRVIVKPLFDFNDFNAKIIEVRKFDLGKPTTEEIRRILSEASNIVKKTPGVIMFIGDSEEGNHVATNYNSSKNKKKNLLYKEPNPIHIYFNIANEHLERAYEIRGKILSQIEFSQDEYYEILQEYFKEISQGIIFLITTIEGFFNQILPDDFALRNSENDETIYKNQIEWLPFDFKLKEIIPLLREINDRKEYEKKYDLIIKINILRNDLIHLKAVKKGNLTRYEDLNKQLLDFDSYRASQAVFEFINTIVADYFIEKMST